MFLVWEGIDEIKYINFCPLLSMFISGNQEYEMEAYFAFKLVLKTNKSAK